MESIHESGRTSLLGISNVTLEQLNTLVRNCRVKPRFVQNRCYAIHGWDRAVRQFCNANDITYQGFSLLTANRAELAHPEITHLANRYGRSTSQIIFRFALDVGMIPLTGTTNADHMREDLEAFEFRLEQEEVSRIGRLIEQR
jgi:diketogulonate reductase-like aldo/keto reductase